MIVLTSAPVGTESNCSCSLVPRVTVAQAVSASAHAATATIFMLPPGPFGPLARRWRLNTIALGNTTARRCGGRPRVPAATPAAKPAAARPFAVAGRDDLWPL